MDRVLRATAHLFSSRRFRSAALNAAVVLTFLTAAWRWSYERNTPHVLAERGFSALARNDARDLCSLTDPEELRRLNLNPTNVAGLLHETLLRSGPLRFGAVRELPGLVPDNAYWYARIEDAPPDAQPLGLLFIDTPGKGWKLCLSEFLFRMADRDSPRVRRRHPYLALSRKYGILGLRQQDDTYLTNEENEARLRAPRDRRRAGTAAFR
jgi:hypothetical protein